MSSHIKLFLSFFLPMLFLPCCMACSAELESSSVPDSSSASSSETSSSPASSSVSSTLLDQEDSSLSAEAVGTAEIEEKSKSSLPLTYQVKTLRETPCYAAPDKNAATRFLFPANTYMEAADIGKVLWVQIELDDGAAGFLYGGDLSVWTEEETVSGETLTQTVVKEKLKVLRERFPHGKYWNHMGQDIPFGEETPFSVTDTPCQHVFYGETYCNLYNGKALEAFPEYGYLCQCLGFAGLISDQIFGEDAPLYTYTDQSQLQIGDEIRLSEYEHSMIVTDITEDSVTVAEVNENYEDCRISWTRTISFAELQGLSWDMSYFSRYPFLIDENGNKSSREELKNQSS